MPTSRQPIAAALGALLVAATALAGCSAPAAPAASSAPPAPTSAAPTAEPTASAPPSAEAGETFTTQIGNASFELPAGWSVRDESAVRMDHDGRDQWMNTVHVLDGEGREVLLYTDGAVDAIGAVTDEWAVVEERAIASALPHDEGLATAAASWWLVDEAGLQVFAQVSAMPDDEPPWGIFPAGDTRLAHFMADLTVLEPCQDVVDESDALACLESPEVAELLDVLASLEQVDVPRDAMP
ncbi:hypothetical protein [Agrococcus sediminis]|uniref:hypothetical protein n=1 Tax=Agrococcus sediminis TaxID=2599924 RepID=UPI00343E293A